MRPYQTPFMFRCSNRPTLLLYTYSHSCTYFKRTTLRPVKRLLKNNLHKQWLQNESQINYFKPVSNTSDVFHQRLVVTCQNSFSSTFLYSTTIKYNSNRLVVATLYQSRMQTHKDQHPHIRVTPVIMNFVSNTLLLNLRFNWVVYFYFTTLFSTHSLRTLQLFNQVWGKTLSSPATHGSLSPTVHNMYYL